MKQLLIVGVDVSKSTLDIFVKPLDRAVRINNDVEGFKKWLKELKPLCSPDVSILIVMEHTGKYSYRFESFLRSKSISYCKINALQIKRSLGMIRGKDDKIDAQRIADYGWLRREILVADEPVTQEIKKLKELLSLRQKMVRDRSGYICRLKEMIASGTCKASDKIAKAQQHLVAVLTIEIQMAEKEIRSLIASHTALQKTCELLVSIKGIGLIIAAYMIGCTENFRRFANARKFNCYAGLAPFKHESGSSLKGRARISHFANKDAKVLLNLAASSAIQHDVELKAYYQKRVAEGKRKMSCLNIIRAKLVARMFAVVKRQTPYQPIFAAA
jgi:transposase